MVQEKSRKAKANVAGAAPAPARRNARPASPAPRAEKYPLLFSEGRLGRLTLRNRVALASMGTGFPSPDGRVTDRHLYYYAARARGGAGLIITELVKVETAVDPSPAGALRLDSDAAIGPMSELVDAIHDHGAAACLQLTPGFGRQGEAVSPDRPPVSSSDIPAATNPSVVCHGLSREEIHALVDAFGRAAERGARAGFDAIEIHGHNGYLVDQFLSAVWNKRADEYGGSLENRLRFALELVRAVRERLGPGFPLSFRYSAELKIPGGRPAEEAREIARRLAEAGVDALNVDAGCYGSMPWMFPPMYFGTGPLLDLAETAREASPVPVIVAGNLSDPELAEKALRAGKCDFVASARGLLADPDWPRKAQEGREADIRRCIMCNEYCTGNLVQGKPIGCVVNPRAGKEAFYEALPAAEPGKVVVAGGGPAGMQAAVTAAGRGHEVVLFERSAKLGGQLLLAGAPEFKRSLRFPVDYLVRRLEELQVDVRLKTEATPERVAREDPDVVVVATGARPVVPDFARDLLAETAGGLPGKKAGPNVLTAWDVHRMGARSVPGNRVVVAGGGLVGCETALDLARAGKEVTIVEMLDELAADLNLVNRFALLSLLREAGAGALTGHRVTGVTQSGVKAEAAAERGGAGATSEGGGRKASKETLIPADTVVLALGAEPERELARSLRGRHARVVTVGDCVRPRRVGDAIREGFVAGLEA